MALDGSAPQANCSTAMNTQVMVGRCAVWAAVFATGLILGGCFISLGDPPGPVAEDGRVYPIQLSADQPIVVRRAHVRLAHDGQKPERILLLGMPGEGGPEEPGYWLSIVAEDQAERSATPLSDDSTASRPKLDILDPCLTGCDRTYLFVNRMLLPAATSVGANFWAGVQSWYRSDSMQQPPGTSAQFTLDDQTVVSRADELVATLSHHFDVAGATPPLRWRATLTVAAASLPDGVVVGAPLLTNATWASGAGDRGPFVTVSVAATKIAINIDPDYPPRNYSLDWLPACQRGVDCLVPVEIEVTWNTVQPATRAVDVELDARLEYLLSPKPGDAAISLTTDPAE